MKSDCVKRLRMKMAHYVIDVLVCVDRTIKVFAFIPRRRIHTLGWDLQQFVFAIIVGLTSHSFHIADAGERSPITVVALGDSTTAPRDVGDQRNGRSNGLTTQGENATDPSSLPHNVVNRVDRTSPWLYVYADVLRDELPLRGIIVKAVDNEGVGGSRTDEAIARLKSDVREKSPNLVIVQFGINDSWWEIGQPLDLLQPDSSGSRIALDSIVQFGGDGKLGNGNDHPHASRGNYTDNLTQIVRTLRAENIQVILMTPNQLSYRGTQLWRNLLLAKYAEAVRKVSKSEQVACVDVWSLYDKYSSDRRRSVQDLLIDREHPNAVAHRLNARSLIEEIVGQNRQ